MANAEDFVRLLLSQAGDRYIFGIEASPDDANPSAFDCSELVQWGLARLGIYAPDGSWHQARWCRDHNTLIPVQLAILTRGALLFKFSSTPFEGGRPSSAHVAVSQGNGMTIEARSTKLGVGEFSAYHRNWTHAGLVPGLDYSEDKMTEQQLAFYRELHDLVTESGGNARSLFYVLEFYRQLCRMVEGAEGHDPKRSAINLITSIRAILPDEEVVTIRRR